MGSRKLYAIKERGTVAKRPKRKVPCESYSDDERCPKQPNLQCILNEVKGLRSDIARVMKLTKDSKLPPRLKVLLGDTFKCTICQDVINPPVVYSRCCKSMIGCEGCVDMWYGGEDGRTKHCPLCRDDRAATETSRLNGLNDFLNGVQTLLDSKETAATSGDNDNSSDPGDEYSFP